MGADGGRYQVKGRRFTRHCRVTQVGALRELRDGNFNHLAGVLFEEDYSVMRAVLVSHAAVLAQSSYVERTNSWRFHLRESVWSLPSVRDVTRELRAAAEL